MTTSRKPGFPASLERRSEDGSLSQTDGSGSQASRGFPTRDGFGDLIRQLSDSKENRRARQTAEWEAMRRSSLRRAG
jgi:hypothetical protein